MQRDPTAAPAAHLVALTGPAAGESFALRPEETLIGRNPTTDITLGDANVSREHAIVSWDPPSGVYVFEDLQSTNGTKLNGKRVRSGDLSPGDVLEVGRTRFELILGDPSEDTEKAD